MKRLQIPQKTCARSCRRGKKYVHEIAAVNYQKLLSEKR